MELLGWIGGTMLAVCGLPQAIQSYRDGHTNGLNWGFLILWGVGEILTLAYVWPKMDWPLIWNYSANLSTLVVIAWYKIKPRKVTIATNRQAA